MDEALLKGSMVNQLLYSRYRVPEAVDGDIRQEKTYVPMVPAKSECF
jgi:hypothetical protein